MTSVPITRRLSEYEAVVGRFMLAVGVSYREAESAVNRIFAAGGRTISPWAAPYIMMELVISEIEGGRSPAVVLKAVEGSRVREALNDWFSGRR